MRVFDASTAHKEAFRSSLAATMPKSRGTPASRRIHPKVVVGDRLASFDVIALVPNTKVWRSDERVRVRCVCGYEKEACVYDLRRASPECQHVREDGTIAPFSARGPRRVHALPKSGDRYGPYTVVASIPRDVCGKDDRVRYRCDCGAFGEAFMSNLRRVKSSACPGRHRSERAPLQPPRAKAVIDLCDFGNALRLVLGLEPLYQDGRKAQSLEEPEERELRRFYVDPFPDGLVTERTPTRGSGC